MTQRDDDDDAGFVSPLPTAYRRPPTHSAHDTRRERTPVTMTSPVRDVGSGSRWRNFVEVASIPPRTAHSEKVSDEWLNQTGDLDRPWLASQRDEENVVGGSGDDDYLFVSKKTRRRWYQKIQVSVVLGKGMRHGIELILGADHAAEQPDDSINVQSVHLDRVAGSIGTSVYDIPREQ